MTRTCLRLLRATLESAALGQVDRRGPTHRPRAHRARGHERAAEPLWRAEPRSRTRTRSRLASGGSGHPQVHFDRWHGGGVGDCSPSQRRSIGGRRSTGCRARPLPPERSPRIRGPAGLPREAGPSETHPEKRGLGPRGVQARARLTTRETAVPRCPSLLIMILVMVRVTASAMTSVVAVSISDHGHLLVEEVRTKGRHRERRTPYLSRPWPGRGRPRTATGHEGFRCRDFSADRGSPAPICVARRRNHAR